MIAASIVSEAAVVSSLAEVACKTELLLLGRMLEVCATLNFRLVDLVA